MNEALGERVKHGVTSGGDTPRGAAAGTPPVGTASREPAAAGSGSGVRRSPADELRADDLRADHVATDRVPVDRTEPDHGDPEEFGRAVGERLRLIRSQKGLSLQSVEAASAQEFKASVLGAYERGERSISVPRLARLAAFYKVPVDQLLPGTDAETPEARRDTERHGAKIDLTRLENQGGAESEMLTRYLHMIQLQRQDFNGRILTIRSDDMRAIACILGVAHEDADRRLAELGLALG